MLRLEDLDVYNLAMEFGEKVWDIVFTWDYFAKDTVGKQLVKSADSIAANISEGYGRYFFKENKQFCYYARGSLMETKTWLLKANKRNLITSEDLHKLLDELETIHKKLNSYIKSIGSKKTHTNPQ